MGDVTVNGMGVTFRCGLGFVSLLVGLAQPSRVFAQAPAVGDLHAHTTSAEEPETEKGPWRLHAALGAPSWLSLSINQRTRYEHLLRQFRVGASGDDRALALRTLVFAEARFLRLSLGGELQDARLYLSDANTPLDASLVNPVEPLQAYVGLRFTDLFVAGDHAALRAGRVTFDVGSRRLVARNRYRNTINAFTGVQAVWQSARADQVQMFATLPVQRRPSAPEELRDQRVRVDRERLSTVFWGAFYASPEGPERLRLETYLFGLYERDAPGAPTKNRRLFTKGVRIASPVRLGAVDVELEGAVQLGVSRASPAPVDTADLDHFAYFGHAGLGYMFDAWASPRLAVEYDYASGDREPQDAHNGRFDTLFGARRFDYGPTGLFGPFSRSNLSSPGVRLEAKPQALLELLAAYRAVWLAQSRDSWLVSGARDPSGRSGSFVGHQLEARLRAALLPENLALELGAAHVWLGGFARTASSYVDDAGPTYVYAQLTVDL